MREGAISTAQIFSRALLTSPETGLAGERAASCGGFDSAVAAGDGMQLVHSSNPPRARFDAGER